MRDWTCIVNGQNSMHSKQHDQQGEEVDFSHLLCSCHTPPGMLHPDLGAPAQESRREVAVSPEEAMKIIKKVEHLTHEERLKELGLFSCSGEVSEEILQQSSSTCRKDGINRAFSNRTRGRCRLDIRKNFFTIRAVEGPLLFAERDELDGLKRSLPTHRIL